jgi:hypothetical protein
VAPTIRRTVSLALLLAAGTVRAAPTASPTRSARLVYVRGRGASLCPGEPAVRDAVTRRLRYDPFQPDATRTVTATVDARGGKLHADVELGDEQGEVAGSRHLEAGLADCDELVAAMALAIAIAIDPQSQLRPPVPAPPPPSPPVDASSPVATAPRPIAAPPRAPVVELIPPPLPALLGEPVALPAGDPLRFRAGLALLGAAGSTPRPTLGLALMGGVRRQWFSAAIEARADLPRSTDAATGGAVSGQLLELTFAPCFHRSWVLACALGSLGALRGVGSGVPEPRTDMTAFGAVGLRLGGEVPVGRVLALTASGDLAAMLPRAALDLRGSAVWTTSPAVATLRFGVVADFP